MVQFTATTLVLLATTAPITSSLDIAPDSADPAKFILTLQESNTLSYVFHIVIIVLLYFVDLFITILLLRDQTEMHSRCWGCRRTEQSRSTAARCIILYNYQSNILTKFIKTQKSHPSLAPGKEEKNKELDRVSVTSERTQDLSGILDMLEIETWEEECNTKLDESVIKRQR